MSNTVFILGAGASQQAGAPLMRNFLDIASDLKKHRRDGDVSRDSELVFKGVDALQSVHSKAQLDICNLESVFAAFEMAKLLKRLAGLTEEEIEHLPSAMRRVICHTLESTIKFPVVRPLETQGRISPAEPFGKLVTILKDYLDKGNSVSFLTFNYDICLDHALRVAGYQPQYWLGSFKPPVLSENINVFKLHGSLNWIRCATCNKIVAWDIREYMDRHYWDLFSGATSVHLNMGKSLHEFQHCGKPAGAMEPIVVPPTWNKTEYHGQLESVWLNAARELSDAENIFVCGYSLPETDKFFHYLYALGSIGQACLRRFWVFNPDSEIESHFRRILGPAALDRFRFFPLKFDIAIREIQNEL
jgi:NAD-dependent SIR2 family protein deacetylase